ncbi:MAG: MarR family winged helix-turn-helix transcriptional regulator [Acidimicrobiia bacterium]
MSKKLRPDDPALIKVDEALLTLGRPTHLRRVGERVRAGAGLPLDRAAYPLLRGIAECGPVRLSDLAARLGVQVSTASRQVKDLEAAGLVERTGDPKDGRVAMLALAPAGKEALKKLRESWRRALVEILEDWPEADREALGALLGRLAAGMVEYGKGG